MTRVRIKFCGVTRVEDARAGAALGVDAIGVVFTPRSRRVVDRECARAIRAALPPFVALVALFMDDPRDVVADVVASVGPDLLQFHGGESAEYCASFGRPYVKAIAMNAVDDPAAFAATHLRASGFVLDSHAPGAGGGTGERFDWARVPADFARPLVLAGGLDARNVAEAIARVRPYAVDVASGIESAPGVKDATRMRDFVAAVRRAESDIAAK